MKKLTDADCDKAAIVWAPDSKSLLWTGSDHKLRRLDVDSGKTEVLASSEGGNIGDPQFSPDGKWISYSQADDLLRSHVWLKELATGQEHDDHVGSVPDVARRQVDAGRQEAAAHRRARRQLRHGIHGPDAVIGLYAIASARVEKGPTDRDINTEAQAEAADAAAPAAGRGGRGGAGAGTAPTNVQVKIDWDGMDQRITQLAANSGTISMVAALTRWPHLSLLRPGPAAAPRRQPEQSLLRPECTP